MYSVCTVCFFYLLEMATISRTGDLNSDTETYKIRPAGLSDDEEQMDAELVAALQIIYYSDDKDPRMDQWMEIPETEPGTSNESHGWVYRIHSESGFAFQLSILTSFLIYFKIMTRTRAENATCVIYVIAFGVTEKRHKCN